MTHHFFYSLRLIAALRVGLVMVIMTGCQLPAEMAVGGQLPTPTPPVTVTAIAPPLIPIKTTPVTSTTATAVTNTLTLTVWSIEDVSPEASGDAGEFINLSLRGFGWSHPKIKVDMVLKKTSGKGGMLDFLRTARAVAPQILPDVAVLNATDLGQAYTDGLIQPLDNRLDRALAQDLIPAARKMGTVDNKLMGIPLALDMEHTVYNTRTFTAPLLLWSDILSNNTKYLFPAKGINGLVNDTTLSLYFSAGGKLLDEEGKPKIDERALRAVLDFYQQALAQKVIAPSVLETSTTEELWPTYLEAKAGLAQISVRQYLTDRDKLKNTSFAPLPVPNTNDTPSLITHGWVLVLVTQNAERQQAALNLIESFMSTDNNATWNKINRSIPTRESAYQQIAGDDPYWTFLAEQVNAAQPQPGFVGYDQIGRIIQQAVQQVLSGELTPEKATATAIDALTP